MCKSPKFSRYGIFESYGRLHKFVGHNPSKNLLKDEQNFKSRDIKKGGSNIKRRSAVSLGPPCPTFLNKYFILKY